MPFIPAAACVKVQLRYAGYGQTMYNVLWYRDTEDAISIASMNDLADVLRNRWEAGFAPLVSTDIALEEVIVTDWSSPTAASTSLVDSVVGTLASPALPLNCTLTTTFKTISRGRSGRGRAYFVGLSEGQVTGNLVNSSVAEDIRTEWSVMGLPWTGEGSSWEHVVVSFQSEGVPRTDGLVQPVINYVQADYKVDSQRRRLSGGGL
jgi:hypothetical protein